MSCGKFNWVDYNKIYNKNTYKPQKGNKNTKWNIMGGGDKIRPFSALPTNDEMKKSVLSRTNEESFVQDILDWLVEMAPRKIRSFLKRLCSHETKITHVDLCESIYAMGFRASEVLERRMILGEANEWVQLYFKDFPRT